LAENLE
jgi:hypothetical protein